MKKKLSHDDEKKIQAIKQRQYTLEKRLEKEKLPMFLYEVGLIIIIRVLVPISLRLEDMFPRAKWAHEYRMKVYRRVSLASLSMAVSRPTHKRGYYMHIIDYQMTEKEVMLVLSPMIGVSKAKQVIKKRLYKYNSEVAGDVKYLVEGDRLYVRMPVAMMRGG